MATFGYCRVSTARQATEGESLDVQRRQIEGYGLMQGLVINEIIIEEGVSGSVPVAQRPAAGPLLASLTAGDVVIAPKLDRLFRSALDALQVVEELRRRGVRLHLLDLGGDIAGNGLSKLFLTIAAAFAEAERDRIRERVGQVKADQRKRARFLGGHKPFGFHIDDDGALVEDPAEQAAIWRMVSLRKRGKSLRAIQTALASKGHKLSVQGVAKLLAATEERTASQSR
jgi:DNA invertase Pin-like site-specific DNA recombinase